jgi:hypothetical protein
MSLKEQEAGEDKEGGVNITAVPTSPLTVTPSRIKAGVYKLYITPLYNDTTGRTVFPAQTRTYSPITVNTSYEINGTIEIAGKGSKNSPEYNRHAAFAEGAEVSLIKVKTGVLPENTTFTDGTTNYEVLEDDIYKTEADAYGNYNIMLKELKGNISLYNTLLPGEQYGLLITRRGEVLRSDLGGGTREERCLMIFAPLNVGKADYNGQYTANFRLIPGAFEYEDEISLNDYAEIRKNVGAWAGDTEYLDYIDINEVNGIDIADMAHVSRYIGQSILAGTVNLN